MKHEIKQKILQKREKLTPEEIRDLSDEIEDNLFSLDEFKNAKNIMFYASFQKEVDTHETIKALLEKKEKRIFVPYVLKNNPLLNVSELKNFNELTPKTFSILEPKEKFMRESDPEKMDLIIVPGLVFGKDGNRIGYGYGYYDRFLKNLKKKIVKVGLSYDFQLLDKIPSEEHDVPMDIIVTEKKIVRC